MGALANHAPGAYISDTTVRRRGPEAVPFARRLPLLLRRQALTHAMSSSVADATAPSRSAALRTPALVVLAAGLGFLAGRRSPTPGGAGEHTWRQRWAAEDARPPARRLEEAVSPGRCKLDRSCAYSIDEDTLEAQVQLARLPLVPEQFRDRIIIELGANTVYTVRDTLLKQPKFRGHYVLSFEPLLDKYAANLAVRSKAVMRAAAGRKCLLASPTTASRLHPPGGSEGAGRSSTSWSAA